MAENHPHHDGAPGPEAGPGSPDRPPAAAPRRRGPDTPSYLVATMREIGDVVCLHPGHNLYLISRPEDVQQVLQANHQNYRQPVPERPLMGHQSLTMSHGDAWRQRRRLMQPVFQPRRLEALAEHVNEATGAFLDRWQSAGAPLEIAGEMVRLSLEALILSLFGADGNRRLQRSVNGAFRYFDARLRRGGKATPRYLPTPENLRLHWALGRMKRSIRRVIARRRRRGAGEGDLLSQLLLAEDRQSGARMNDRQLVDELMMLLVMGHMTTAMALTWTWYLLARHPAAERRLHRELDAVLAGRPPAVEDLPRLVHTRRVVEEALRLYPPSWLLSRVAAGPDVIGGYAVPAGSMLWISPYAVHRREELWPRPEEFDPDRFAPGQDRHRFAYLPFGGGPRTCIAEGFAMMEIPLVVARIAQHHRLELEADHRVVAEAAITLEPRGGLPMTLRRR